MSWESYLSILREAAQEARDEQTRPPAACPDCGEPLLQGPTNERFCKFDGYQYPRDGRL